MFSKAVIGGAIALASGFAASSPITSADGLVFSIALVNQTTTGGPFDLAVRLNQYNPSIGLAPYFDFYVGVDPNSPKLVGNLDSGAVYSQGIGPDNEPYNNTYTLYVNVEEDLGNTTTYTTGFGNITADATFLDNGWALTPSGGTPPPTTLSTLNQRAHSVAGACALRISTAIMDHGQLSNT